MAASRKSTSRKRKGASAPMAPVTATSTTSGWSGMTSSQRIAWVCLHVLVFAVPVTMSNWTIIPGVHLPLTFDQFDIIKVFLQRGITLIAFGAWAWHVLVNGGTVRRTKVDYLILAVLGWFALSAIFSIHPPTALFGKYRRYEGLISFITYATIYFLAVQFLDRISRVRSLARTLFFAGVVVNGYGVMQYLGIDPFVWGRLPFEANRSFSTYGNPDLLGGFIVISLAVTLALALSENDYRWRFTYWAGFLLGAVCWVTAFTRGAWIGGAVGLAVIIFAAARAKTALTRVDWTFAGAIAAAVGLVVFRSLQSTNAVMNVAKRLVSIFEFDQGSALTRFQIWDAAWRATLDRPVFGFGPDTFRLVFPGYKPVEYTQTAGYISVADNVHNYILQLTSAVGIPGMLLLYGLFAAIAVFSARNAFKRPESEKDTGRLVLAGFWAAAAGYVVHLTFGLSVTGATFLLWVSMAALMAPHARTVEFKAPSWGVYAASATLVAVLVASVANFVYIQADNAYLMARLGGGYEQRLGNAKLAVARNPYNDMYRAEVGLAHTDAFFSIAGQMRNAQDQGQDIAPARAEAERVFLLAEASLLETIDFIEYEYDNYVFLTNLYNTAADVLSPEYNDRALATARKGIEVSEFGPAIRVQYAIALLTSGNNDEAERQLRAAAEMDLRYTEPNVLLGDVLARKGDYEGALVSYERVRELDPEYPGIDETIVKTEEALTGATRESAGAEPVSTE